MPVEERKVHPSTIAQVMRGAMVRARLTSFLLGLLLAIGFLIPVPFIQGQVANSHAHASAVTNGNPSRIASIPSDMLLFYAYVALLIFTCIRAPIAWYAARRATGAKLERSRLIEKFAAGELEDATEHYIWPLRIIARLAKPGLGRQFQVATKNIDWHCHQDKRLLPQEWPFVVGSLIMAIYAAVNFLLFFYYPKLGTDPYLTILPFYALVYLQIPPLSANMATMSESARLALLRMET